MTMVCDRCGEAFPLSNDVKFARYVEKQRLLPAKCRVMRALKSIVNQTGLDTRTKTGHR